MQFCRPDKEVEERAQKAIDNFFSNNLIAPSPWNSNAKGKAGASNLVGMCYKMYVLSNKEIELNWIDTRENALCIYRSK